MKLEIKIQVTKKIGYNDVPQLTQSKDIEIEEIGCVKTARGAIERVADEFLLDLKEIQKKAELAAEAAAPTK